MKNCDSIELFKRLSQHGSIGYDTMRRCDDAMMLKVNQKKKGDLFSCDRKLQVS